MPGITSLRAIFAAASAWPHAHADARLVQLRDQIGAGIARQAARLQSGVVQHGCRRGALQDHDHVPVLGWHAGLREQVRDLGGLVEKRGGASAAPPLVAFSTTL